MRKLASIRRIDDIRPIVDADAIEVAILGGWYVVVKKGEFKAGDLAIYCEIDSWIPHELAPFLSKGTQPREFNGVRGERLRTVKLRGQVSQGLLLHRLVALDRIGEIHEGQDVSELLNIQKWEAPVPAQLAGKVRGMFPSCVPKTDQERVANLAAEWEEYRNHVYEISEKCEGASCTMMLIDGDFHVCSRNLSLYRDENTTYWKVALKNDVENKLRELGYDNIAIQAEVLGPGIQNNIYKLTDHDLYVFDVFDIKTGKYYTSNKRVELCRQLKINHVPVLATESIKNKTVQDVISMADGFSQLNKKVRREGIVFKSVNSHHHFKSVSPQYLLKSEL